MDQVLEHRFSIKRLRKASYEDYISALKIYNETTPPEIKTNTNEITYWLEQNSSNQPFEIMLFSLYLNSTVIGLAMLTYLKKTNTVIFEYLALQQPYRLNAVFFTFISLLQNYINENNMNVAYYIVEINNRNHGKNIDKESKLFKRLFCLENFGKINAPYYTPPLGIHNHESSFESILYIRSNDNITKISKETYLDIIKSIYYDYNVIWYNSFMDSEEKDVYKKAVDNIYQMVVKQILHTTECDISYVDCPLFHEPTYMQSNTILPTVVKPQNKYLLSLVLGLIACTILMVWIYNIIFAWLGIPINNVGVIIGNITSALITAVSAIFFIKQKS